MAGRVDPAAVETLRSLPSKHRAYLLQRFADELKKSWNQELKFARIAQLLGPTGTQRYNNLYLSGNGTLFAWYVASADLPQGTNTRANVHAIFNRIARENPGVETGLFPKLSEDDPTPKLHKIYNYTSYVAVEYASLDATRTYTLNWETKRIHVDRVYRLVVRNNPFSIEVRASGKGKQETLVELLATEAAIPKLLDKLTPCHLTSGTKRDSLDKNLKARFCGSDLNFSTAGLSSMKLRSEDGKRMDKSTEYIEQMKEEGREETRRTYEYKTAHGDGYDEVAEFTIGLESGEVRVSGAASELAIENLRQHVVALF